MRALVVYESLYGNTKHVAEAIATGIRRVDPTATADVLPVAEAEDQVPAGVDLLVIGGPTHAWSMTRPGTRQGAIAAAGRPDAHVSIEPAARQEVGVREWLERMVGTAAYTAAFDTRRRGPKLLTGRASSAIARRLRKHTEGPLMARESFLVDKQEKLVAGEVRRAEAWGSSLAREVWDILGAASS